MLILHECFGSDTFMVIVMPINSSVHIYQVAGYTACSIIPLSRGWKTLNAQSHIKKIMSPCGWIIHDYIIYCCWLKDKMKTASGRLIAQKRHKVVENWLLQFKAEWEGTSWSIEHLILKSDIMIPVPLSYFCEIISSRYRYINGWDYCFDNRVIQSSPILPTTWWAPLKISKWKSEFFTFTVLFHPKSRRNLKI